MKIYTLWMRSPYQGPDLVDAWDEGCVDDNPEGWIKAIKDGKRAWGEGPSHEYAIVIMEVAEKDIVAAFTPQVVQAAVVSGEGA